MKIKEKQNTEDLLKKQYVARHCYNTAELYGVLSWASCIALVVIAVNFDSNKEIVAYIVAIVTILECAFDSIRQLYIKLGAAYRMYIDDVLFEFEEKEYYVEYSLKQLNCFAEQVIKIHKNTSSKQINHSGTDKYKGVRDWYNCNGDGSRQEIIYLCQKENKGFDIIISGISIGLTALLFLLGLIIIVKVDESGIIICSCAALGIKAVKSVVSIIKYYAYQKRTEFLCGQVEASGYDIVYIQQLQENINYRRQLNIVSFSAIHKLLSKILHKCIN